MSTCPHCKDPVQWGRTEGGFAGHVHVDTGRAACGSARIGDDLPAADEETRR